MARLTITLSEERHRALKEAAARTHKSLGQIIEESLKFCGIKTTASAQKLVEQARQRSALTPAEAEKLALRETRAQRMEGQR